MWSRSNAQTYYPTTPIWVTITPQQASNWCGPSSLQAEIQYVKQHYYSGLGTQVVVPIIPQATLWAFMRDNCSHDLGGRDFPLTGTVGDGTNQVRKLNIAYDFGVDPHAVAWTMYANAPLSAFYNYHYWIYYNDATEATNYLLYALERHQDPVIVAVFHGSHLILITGYQSDYLAYPGPPGTIKLIKTVNPSDGSQLWFSIGDWYSYWLTTYTDTRDPDPATGWYVPPPDHWQGHWVTIQRDNRYDINPDYGMSLNGYIVPTFRRFLPQIAKPN